MERCLLVTNFRFGKSNIELSCRPDRSYVLTALRNYAAVPSDLQADNSNDLLGGFFLPGSHLPFIGNESIERELPFLLCERIPDASCWVRQVSPIYLQTA